MRQKNKRIDWVDSVKAVAILAVILGHISTPLTLFLFSWHLPLFFFVFGFFLNMKESFMEGIAKDFKKYMIPFFIFALFGLGIEYIKRWLFPHFPFITPIIHVDSELMGIFYYMDFIHMHQYGFVLWFLPALFWAKRIFLILVTYVPHLSIQCFFVVGFFLFGLYGWKLPFAFNTGCIGLLWMFIGHTMFPFLKRVKISFWVSLMCFLVCFFLPTPRVNIAIYRIDAPWYAIPYSLIIIMSIISMVQYVQQNILVRFLSFWGKETLTIFIIHPYINNIASIISGLIFSNIWGLTYVISLVGISAIVLAKKRLWIFYRKDTVL